MGTRKNKTRLGEWEYTIQKPMANDVVMRNGLFVALQDGYIIPADGTTEIEGMAINDRYSGENNEHRYCIYQPKRDREHFTMEVDNGIITQEDVGKTFWITGGLQHINYSTKAEKGGQFRLEEVLNDTLGTFTYNKDVQFAPQGPQGNDGQTPELQMGTVTKLPSDAQPTAQLVQDPQDPTKYTLNLGIPAGSKGEKGIKGDTGDKGDKGNTGAAGINGTNGLNGTNGIDGDYPHREGDWNGGTTYTHLAMVRYPDQNNEYWTWIWNSTEPAVGSTPGVDNRRGKMNKDGDEGPKGEDGGTVVIPVEGKPGKDGIGVNGRDGDDGISPHNEGERDSTEDYDKLAMVRARTGEYDQRGNEIRGYYVTQNGAGAGQDPKTSSNWQLVSKDGIATLGNPYTVMAGLKTGRMYLGQFDQDYNLPAKNIEFDCYTGNPDMIQPFGVILIKKTGHYRVFGHIILHCNNTGGNHFINLARYSITLITRRSGTAVSTFIATAKEGGPSTSGADQGPWLDLYVDTQVDLYEGDRLFGTIRCQTDDTSAYDPSKPEGERGEYGYYKIIGADDTSGMVEDGEFVGGFFASYMGVEYLSAHTWQSDTTNMMVSDL